MKILSGEDDYFHFLSESGSYEWTYFDGNSEDGRSGFSAIWFRGVPMSPIHSAAVARGKGDADPENYYAFAFGLHADGTELCSILEEGDRSHFELSDDQTFIRFGTNSLRWSLEADSSLRCTIDVRSSTHILRRSVEGIIELRFPPFDYAPVLLNREHPTDRSPHSWVPARPDGTFRAEFFMQRGGGRTDRIVFSGRCYHDRNFGRTPLQHLDVVWHWGRVHAGSDTVVYFDIRPLKERSKQGETIASEEPNVTELSLAVIVRNGILLKSWNELDLKSRFKSHWTTMELPMEITISAEPGLSIATETEIVLNSAPFYHRLLSRFSVRFEEEELSGHGIQEYLRPDRLRVPWFRPFVRFMVRRFRTESRPVDNG